METEEITKLVDGIYKNILDKFNPGARQMINAGKAYLKALHGAATASRMYVDAITKLARQSQQGTWGGSADIGSALMQIVEVYKEIQSQQMNILKAFYVDLLVPLETNLEKDTKVVQSEQKKFLQQHKQRSETYSKAAATIKKQRKKQRNTAKTGIAMDKELKSMQILEEERSKLDAFCEQSLKNAMTQERRRYGFVLERHCSLAKHYLAYHNAGHTLYQNHLDEWQEVAKTREFLPHSVENMFASKLTTVSFWGSDGGSPKGGADDEERASLNGGSTQLRKTKSMDASCLDVRNLNEIPPQHASLTRAKSDFNLTASTQSLSQDVTDLTRQLTDVLGGLSGEGGGGLLRETTLRVVEMTRGGRHFPPAIVADPNIELPTSPATRRPKSLAVAPSDPNWDTPLARAMYAYLSSGENQLSFLEGDIIALMGERNKGWQFGENLRTQCSGWFPLAYTEPFIDDTATSASSPTHKRAESSAGLSPGNRNAPVTRFGDTLALRNPCQVGSSMESSGGVVSGFSGGPPATPAPVAPRILRAGGGGVRGGPGRVPPPPTGTPGGGPPTTAPSSHLLNPSLHSSNDSGFSNDPPPAPEVDYSDDDTTRNTIQKNNRKNKSSGKYSQRKTKGWLSDSVDEDWYASSIGDKSLSRRGASLSAGQLATLGRGGGRGGDEGEGGMRIEEVQARLRAVEIPYDKKGVKRSKSLWKFKRGPDPPLEGMAMWKHRSLIDISPNGTRSSSGGGDKTPRPGKKPLSLMAVASGRRSNNGTNGGPPLTTPRGAPPPPRRPPPRDSSSEPGSDPGSDSESCIVVDDHRKRPEALLPRTRLLHKKRGETVQPSWYNSWDSVKQL